MSRAEGQAEQAAQRVEEARSRFERGDLVGALEAFEDAMRADPTCDDAVHGREAVLAILDDTEGAVGFYTEAIEATGGHADMFVGRGHLRWHGGDLDGAIADYGAAIERSSEPSAIQCIRARAREARGDLDGALGDYREVVERGPPGESYVIDAEREIERLESRFAETLIGD